MRTISIAALTIGALALLAGSASAREFPGWGDTGWAYASKRECCNGAVAIAQQYSAQACIDIGGTPSPLRGGVQRRGFCTWETASDDSGAALFRCYAEATVPCR
jgi:hypothetical protein